MNTISLVTDVFLSKRDALSVLSDTLRLPVQGGNSSDPWIEIEGGVALHIEIPKFGEDLPLTLDVTGANPTQLDEVCTSLSDTLSATQGWTISRLEGGGAR